MDGQKNISELIKTRNIPQKMFDSQDNSAEIKNKLMRIFLEREIANFQTYLNILEKELNRVSQEISTRTDDSYIKLNEIKFDEEVNSELINLIVAKEQAKEFTNLMRQSFLTSLYSFMELWLVRACRIDSKLRGEGVPNKYKEKEIWKLDEVREYFSGTMKSNYPFDLNQDWGWINNFRQLRNCIIHRQGSLTGHSDWEIKPILAEFVTSENCLSLFGVENRQIFVEYEFCVKALKTVHRFMVELLSL